MLVRVCVACACCLQFEGAILCVTYLCFVKRCGVSAAGYRWRCSRAPIPYHSTTGHPRSGAGHYSFIGAPNGRQVSAGSVGGGRRDACDALRQRDAKHGAPARQHHIRRCCQVSCHRFKCAWQKPLYRRKWHEGSVRYLGWGNPCGLQGTEGTTHALLAGIFLWGSHTLLPLVWWQR